MNIKHIAGLRPGTHVQLKCGSPLLRVLRAGRDLVTCIWVDAAKRARPIVVPPHYLVIAAA